MSRRLALLLPFTLACGRPAVAVAPVEAKAGAAASSAGAPIRFALPACPLGYHVLVREKSYDGDDLQFDTERFEDLTATTVNGRMQLKGTVVGRSLHDGVRDHGNPADDYAPPLLETDGLSWTERDGPTWLFSDVGAQGGLAWFFPTIPASSQRGATAEWNVPYQSGQSTAALRTEIERGRIHPMFDPSEPERVIPTTFTPATIRVEDTHVESGVRVMELTLTGERHNDSAPDDPFEMTVVKTYRATYAITATGRVLRAHVESKQTMKTARQTMVDTADAQMNLVKACDGPVAPSLAPVLTAQELAQPEDHELRIVLPPPKKKK